MVIESSLLNTRHHRPSGAPTRPFTSELYRHYADNAAIKTADSCLEKWNRSAFTSGHPEPSSSGDDVNVVDTLGFDLVLCTAFMMTLV